MIVAGLRKTGWVASALVCLSTFLLAQHPSAELDTTGQLTLNNRSTPYRIRHLPVTSFPELPAPLADLLTQRGCLIPQTYQAHHPENVIHASLERLGSSDWAVLCSVQGTVSLFVYFASDPTRLVSLASAPETDRLQIHDVTGVLGFNWGIDPASPEQVHQAHSGMTRPQPVDHDAVVDTIINHRSLYRFYTGSAWTTLEMPE